MEKIQKRFLTHDIGHGVQYQAIYAVVLEQYLIEGNSLSLSIAMLGISACTARRFKKYNRDFANVWEKYTEGYYKSNKKP